MSQMRSQLRYSAIGVVAATLALVSGLNIAWTAPAAPAAATAAAETEIGITKPSEERELSIPQPFLLKEVKVKEGDEVKAGDLVVAQDDSADQVLRAQLELQAKSKVQIIAQKAELNQKEVALKRRQELKRTGDATETEVEEAQL